MRIEMASYRNPPVIEAVCEFRFPKGTQWPEDITEKFYEKVKDSFPHKEVHKGQELEITAKEDDFRHKIVSIERTTLQSEKPRIQIHIGNRILSIHCLQPYPSWEVFLPRIQRAFDTIRKVTDITGIDRIGLLYLDKIEIPEGGDTLGEYFNFYPFIGKNLPKNFINFIVGCEFPFADMRDICRLQLTRALQERPGYSTFILSTDYYLAKRHMISQDDVDEWLENAHQEVREIFEGSITDKMRALFELEGN
jgi:uncharacterized protein (TIGR04255 family)